MFDTNKQYSFLDSSSYCPRESKIANWYNCLSVETVFGIICLTQVSYIGDAVITDHDWESIILRYAGAYVFVR